MSRFSALVAAARAGPVLAAALALTAAESLAQSGQPADTAEAAVKSAASASPAKRRPARVLPGLAVELKTADGWTLAAQYSRAQADKSTFVLLHETGGRKENWYFLVKEMARRGIGALAVDLRGHGASQRPPPGGESSWRRFRTDKEANDWINMSRDLDAAVEYLKSQGVPEASIALGGADVGSSIALRFAAVNERVPMLFMLSPGFSYREVLTVNAVRKYGRRPILMVVGSDDKHCLAEIPILYQYALNAAGPENARRIDAEKEHGTRLLVVNKGLVARIVDWMEHPEAVQPPAASTPTETQPPGLPTDQELLDGRREPAAPSSPSFGTSAPGP